VTPHSGEGGHTARLLELCSDCTVTAIDADAEMLRRGRIRFAGQERLSFTHGWFDEVLSTLDPQDRILMDVGVSMFHLRETERGFSLREDGPLDMRLDATGDDESAAELIGRIGEAELADIIFLYGEERYARRIARGIVRDRQSAAASTAALAEVVSRSVPAQYRHGRNHPATRTFQALRIAVNDELGRIERAVPAAARALAPGGRLAAITFHSLEDRIVKRGFRFLAGRGGDVPPERMTHPVVRGWKVVTNQPMYEGVGDFRLVTRKPIVPSEAETAANPASRSAKLRVLERVERRDERR
jgi:16S rRNA (cytosine1402-N4)-methyltransferase